MPEISRFYGIVIKMYYWRTNSFFQRLPVNLRPPAPNPQTSRQQQRQPDRSRFGHRNDTAEHRRRPKDRLKRHQVIGVNIPIALRIAQRIRGAHNVPS